MIILCLIKPFVNNTCGVSELPDWLKVLSLNQIKQENEMLKTAVSNEDSISDSQLSSSNSSTLTRNEDSSQVLNTNLNYYVKVNANHLLKLEKKTARYGHLKKL